MSRWYAAHILMYVKRPGKLHGKIPVWENIVLIKANSEEAAFAKAEQRGKQDEGNDDGTFRWHGERAAWVYAGIRKMTLCEDSERRPGDGSEVSYTEMEVNSQQALWSLLEGKPIAVKVMDFSEDSSASNVRLAVVRQGA